MSRAWLRRDKRAEKLHLQKFDSVLKLAEADRCYHMAGRVQFSILHSAAIENIAPKRQPLSRPPSPWPRPAHGPCCMEFRQAIELHMIFKRRASSTCGWTSGCILSVVHNWSRRVEGPQKNGKAWKAEADHHRSGSLQVECLRRMIHG